MKIVALESSNVKALKAISVSPKGAVVHITGKNGAGKSSVLDSIFMALSGKDALPAKPVRDGEEKAVIRLDLGDVIVTRRINADRTGTVSVKTADGANYPSPQKLLDALIGPISFDPIKFATLPAKQQLDTLRSLVKLDVDVEDLDRQNLRDYELRAQWNRAAKNLTERLTTLADGVDWNAEVTPIDVAEIAAKVDAAVAHNKAIDAAVANFEQIQANSAELLAEQEAIEREIARLQDRLSTVRATRFAIGNEIKAWTSPGEPLAIQDIQRELQDATKENMRREQQRTQRAKAEQTKADLDEAVVNAERITAAMKARVEQKTKAIAAANMPVAGLSFGDGLVLFNGIPLEQCAMSEKLRVSCAIAEAQNPQLRVVLIRDASLYDDDSMQQVAAWAEAKGIQAWIERVGKSSDVGIVIEDGEVVSVDGVPVEAEATAAD